MWKPALLSIFAAIGFGGWPLIARLSQASSLWINVVLTVTTGLFVSLALAKDLVAQTRPSLSALGLLALAGAINAIGFLAYGKVIGNPEWEISQFLPLVVITMTLVTGLGGILFFGEVLTVKKVLGLALALVAAWLLVS